MQQQRRQSAIPTPVFAQERRQSHRPPPIPPASPVVRQVNAAKGKGPVKTLAFAETTQMDELEDMGDTQQWRDGVEDDLDDGEVSHESRSRRNHVLITSRSPQFPSSNSSR